MCVFSDTYGHPCCYKTFYIWNLKYTYHFDLIIKKYPPFSYCFEFSWSLTRCRVLHCTWLTTSTSLSNPISTTINGIPNPKSRKTLTYQTRHIIVPPMTSSSSSSSITAKVLLLVLLLLIASSTSAAARIGPTPVILQVPTYLTEAASNSHAGVKTIKSFRFKELSFGFLPKGSKAAPSGPSKRHNSVVASTPKHWD